MHLIDGDALINQWATVPDKLAAGAGENKWVADMVMGIQGHFLEGIIKSIEDAPTIEAVPVKFIDEVIEYLTKCRDYAIHEETKTTWDEQRQTLIMLLHEWAAWNECGRTGKYGERREG